ncbi:MAG: 30S ribosomal protein S18 [Candidatus Babeliales bacterium]
MKKRINKLKISGRLLQKKARRLSFSPRKHCRFCGNAEVEQSLDYKNSPLLKGFLTERGKILPSRISGVCTRHQRSLAHEIKKSRVMALLPYTSSGY